MNEGTRPQAAKNRTAQARPDDARDSNSLVPQGGVFEGQVAVAGRTRIDGAVRGTLRGPGTLILGPSAHVEGVIECEGVASEGHVIGPIHTTRHVQLKAGARLEGDLETPLLRVDDDAVWTGRATIGDPRGRD